MQGINQQMKRDGIQVDIVYCTSTNKLLDPSAVSCGKWEMYLYMILSHYNYHYCTSMNSKAHTVRCKEQTKTRGQSTEMYISSLSSIIIRSFSRSAVCIVDWERNWTCPAIQYIILSTKVELQSWTNLVGTPCWPFQCCLQKYCSQDTFTPLTQHRKGMWGFMPSSGVRFRLYCNPKIQQSVSTVLSMVALGTLGSTLHVKNMQVLCLHVCMPKYCTSM